VSLGQKKKILYYNIMMKTKWSGNSNSNEIEDEINYTRKKKAINTHLATHTELMPNPNQVLPSKG
jgi:hypothetical protein